METNTTGVDEHVELIVDGDLLSTFSDVIRFETEDEEDEIVIKGMGRSGSRTIREFVAHTGTMEVSERNEVVEAAMDKIREARISRTPMPVTLVHVVRHKMGPVVTKTYSKVEVSRSRSSARGEMSRLNLTWRTGEPVEVS